MAGSSPLAAMANSSARAGSMPVSPLSSSTSRSRRPPPLALIQFEFDAPVAAQIVLAVALAQRAEFGKARGHEAIGRDALGNQEFDHGDGACRRQLPVGSQLPVIGLLVGVAVDPQQPVDVGGNARGYVLQRVSEGCQLALALLADGRGGRIEQHLRLEDEPVADDLDIRTAAQDFLQFAEEL